MLIVGTLLIDAPAVELAGGGTVTLQRETSLIDLPANPDGLLDNINNTIDGEGHIGNAGDQNLTLQNDLDGTIDADIGGAILTIDTGNLITNNGLMEATSGSTLIIDDALAGTGSYVVGGGSTVIGDKSTLHSAVRSPPGP